MLKIMAGKKVLMVWDDIDDCGGVIMEPISIIRKMKPNEIPYNTHLNVVDYIIRNNIIIETN